MGRVSYLTEHRYRRAILPCLLLLITATLTGQLSERYNSEVQLPDGGGTYHITFLAKFTGGTTAGPNGSIILQKAGKVLLKLQDYRVTGPDPEVAKEIKLRLELPPSGGGHRLNLSSGGLDRATLTVNKTGRLGLFSKTSIIYQERKIKGGTFDLTRVFTIPAAAVAIPSPPPPPPPTIVDPVIDPVTDDRSPDKVPPVVVPVEKPQWEKDFETLSPEAFVDKWPRKTTLVREKLRLIDLLPTVEEVATNRYELTFDYVSEVRLDSITGGTGFQVESDEKVPPFGHRIVVVVTDAGTYRMHLSDKNKNKGVSVIALDNLLTGKLRVAADTVTFTFKGGVPPYQLLFYRDGALVKDRQIGDDSTWVVPIDNLRQLAGGPGDYIFRLQDQQKTVSWNYGGVPVSIPKRTAPPVDTKIPLLLGGSLVALALLLIIRGSRRRSRRARIRENLNEPGTQPLNPSPALAAAPTETPRPEPTEPPVAAPIFKEVKEATTEEPVTAGQKATAGVGGFRVTRRAKIDNTTRPFHPDIRPRDFLPLHLERNWTESQVATVFFNKQSIFVLDDFLRRENTSKIAGSGAVAKDGGWERNEAIPEIGGMLMGQYHLGEDGKTYRVSVEEFIPLKAKTQNVVKVQIDPMSLARDLSAAQDAHPELTVIGWFHTHPGHGLFLSQPDLKVQFGQFREPYHFAMEIDSLTENLDTAFFTYLPSGKMNNRDTRRPDSNWFSWSEIEKFTRRNSPN